MKIREIQLDDAEAFLELSRKLDQETRFMLLGPGERTTTLPEQQAEIADLKAAPNATIFVVEDDDEGEGKLIGYLGVYGGRYLRNQKTAYIVIGIRKTFTGLGLGTRLFQAMESWARDHNIHRLELTVMVDNQAGVALYQKQGFIIEGIRREVLYSENQYQDEYWMAKLL